MFKWEGLWLAIRGFVCRMRGSASGRICGGTSGNALVRFEPLWPLADFHLRRSGFSSLSLSRALSPSLSLARLRARSHTHSLSLSLARALSLRRVGPRGSSRRRRQRSCYGEGFYAYLPGVDWKVSSQLLLCGWMHIKGSSECIHSV